MYVHSITFVYSEDLIFWSLISRLVNLHVVRWFCVIGDNIHPYSCYLKQLARQGLNVVLMSRSQEKLNKVAKEISESKNNTLPPNTHTCALCPPHTRTHITHLTHTEEKYGRETRVLSTDFSKGEEVYPEIAEKLKDLDIGILGKRECHMIV